MPRTDWGRACLSRAARGRRGTAWRMSSTSWGSIRIPKWVWTLCWGSSWAEDTCSSRTSPCRVCMGDWSLRSWTTSRPALLRTAGGGGRDDSCGECRKPLAAGAVLLRVRTCWGLPPYPGRESRFALSLCTTPDQKTGAPTKQQIQRTSVVFWKSSRAAYYMLGAHFIVA
jgi:hypothetical protein